MARPEADAVAGSEATTADAASALENIRLRRELGGLRAFAEWQRGELLAYGSAVAAAVVTETQQPPTPPGAAAEQSPALPRALVDAPLVATGAGPMETPPGACRRRLGFSESPPAGQGATPRVAHWSSRCQEDVTPFTTQHRQTGGLSQRLGQSASVAALDEVKRGGTCAPGRSLSPVSSIGADDSRRCYEQQQLRREQQLRHEKLRLREGIDKYDRAVNDAVSSLMSRAASRSAFFTSLVPKDDYVL